MSALTATTSRRPARLARRPARRAVRRWAWRLFRREWRQQMLVLALLTVSIAGSTVGLGVITNVTPSAHATLGTANTRIDVPASAAGFGTVIGDARRVFATVEVIEHQNVPVPGSITPVDLRAQSPDGVFGHPLLRLVSGRYPAAADQVAMTSGVAATFGVHVGDTWRTGGRTMHVVGIVENPKDLQDAFVLAVAGSVAQPSSVTLLLNGDAGQVKAFHPAGVTLALQTTATSGPAERTARALAVLVLNTIGLIFVGLLSVAGFTVMAARRQRALGMIGAVGADDRHVRMVMISNGLLVGTAGATAGTALGLAAWFASVPLVDRLTDHRIDRLDLPWWAIATAAVLTVVTAVAAAWWPARAAARVPIVAAIAGRPSRPQPAHRFAAVGVTLLGLGGTLLVLADQRRTPFIVTGIVSLTAGMLLLAPGGIRAVGRLAGRVPVSARLALRDLARYQARSGAALAAVSLAIGIAATISITSAAQAAARPITGGNLPANQLIVWIAGRPGPPESGKGVRARATAVGDAPAPTGAQLAELRSRVRALSASLHGRAPLELDVAANLRAPLPNGGVGVLDAALVLPIATSQGAGWSYVTEPFVGTPAVLDFYRLPAGDTGADVITARTDLAGVRVLVPDDKRVSRPTSIRTDKHLPNYSSAPNTLITPRAQAALGLSAKPVGWLIQTLHALTPAQIADARRAAVAAGVSIETRTAPDRSPARLRAYATALGVLLALGVLAMTVGLLRSETGGDLRILTAVGAGSRTRRTLVSATAGTLALLGALLGVAGAYLALLAWYHRDLGYLAHPPLLELAALLVGLPALAVIGGWFGSARAPSDLARPPGG